MTSLKFKNVPTTERQKLKYEGFCTKCGKKTFHRFVSGTLYKSSYKCIKCGTINIERRL